MLRLVAVTADVPDPISSARFWGALLDRDVRDDGYGVLLPGDGSQVGLRFAAGEPGPGRLHLHLTSSSEQDQQRTVESALAEGARHLDVGQTPEEGHVVLADPGGDPFCVIEPGNGFLAGCGRLGEVTCEGTRAVGVFWHLALEWPLVWDEDGETAIQARTGGTKLSWGGPPLPPKQGRNRQRFDLASTDPDDLARLLALGAREIGPRDGGLELADPDGNELRLTDQR